ncbi:MAG: hypothetical protein KDD82_06395, partial [Planctomycetes bacterium]|nr:hypothetical protein [Planctomycetota bacterium]
PSAAALAEDLERLLRGEGASAASGGAAGPFPRGVLPALALAGIGVLAVWVARLATRPAPSPPPSVAPERSRVERALATLAASEGEARVRSSALARLSAAADPAHVDHEAVAAGLEQALAAEEGTPELHLLRARFDLAGGTSLRVADLSACAALEVRHVGELCLAAMERGTSPPLRTPSARAAARALYAAHPESSAAAWLLGVTLCAGGDPADCAQAAEVLVEPSARQAPRAYLAAKVLRAAGECRAFLEAREAPADGGAALVEGLEALRADPELEAAPAVVLALLREVVHEVILEAAALDLTQREVPLTVVRAFTAAGASLRPDQRALFALLIDGMDEAPAEYVAPSSAEFAAWSEALAATGDPLLGGVGLEVSIRYRLENEGPADPSELLALLGRARRSAALLGPLPADATTWADQRSMRSHHRLAVDRVQLHSKLAAAASDEAAREEALRTAREAALEALELVDRFGLSWRADIEPDAVIRLSLELGDLDAAANLASRSKAPCALEAELLRLRGRPRDALAAVEAALADPSTAAAEQADLRAVQALTLADVGQLDEARRVLLELGEAFLTDPEVLRELWLPSAVASQLER